MNPADNDERQPLLRFSASGKQPDLSSAASCPRLSHRESNSTPVLFGNELHRKTISAPEYSGNGYHIENNPAPVFSRNEQHRGPIPDPAFSGSGYTASPHTSHVRDIQHLDPHDPNSNGTDICTSILSISKPTNRRAKIVLPLIVVTYFLGYIVSMVIMNPYIYDRVAHEFDYQVNTSSRRPCIDNMDNSTGGNATGKKIQEEIERKVASIELYLHLTTYLPAVIPILWVGPLTDRVGRRVGFLLPISGTLLKQIVYIVVVWSDLPLSVLFLAHAIEAVGGSFAAMLSVVFTVTSDLTTSGRERSGWISAMEALFTISMSLGQIAIAQWMQMGYLLPLIYALVMCCLAWVLACFFIPETNTKNAESRCLVVKEENAHSICPDSCSDEYDQHHNRSHSPGGKVIKTVKRSFSVYTSRSVEESTSNVIVWKRYLCLLVFVLTVAVTFSSTSVTALFQMKYPLCWPSVKVYTFNGLRILSSWVIILSMLALLQRYFKMADRHVAVIGVLSAVVSNSAMAVAVNDVMVYEAVALGVMTRSVLPMLRSVLSSLVDQTQQGALYSGLSCIESLGASVFATASNRIYYATLSTWAGAIFAVFAGVMGLALVLLVTLNGLFVKYPPPRTTDCIGPGNIQEAEQKHPTG